MTDKTAIRDIVAFVLAQAGRADEWQDRELGPIHLIKYLYLADLYVAEAGRPTVTGIEWTFFHFGPWAAELPDLLNDVASEIGAERRDIDGRHGEFIRWRFQVDDDDYEYLKGQVAPAIRVRLGADIRRFGNATEDLLHHVYTTEPMLRAKPRDRLRFDGLHNPAQNRPPEEGAPAFNRSKPKRVKLIEKLAGRLEERRRLRLEEAAESWTVPEVKYDEVFEKGLAELEGESDHRLEQFQGVAAIDPSVWISDFRKKIDG